MFEQILEMTTIIWLILTIALIVIEALTVTLVSIWFAGGSLAATICSALGLNIGIQIAVFIIVSIILLCFTRKFFVDKLKVGSKKTNKDELIGKIAIVINPIEPFEGGRVKIGGMDWKAIFEDNALSADIGEEVIVKAIKGVKLIVKKIEE